MVLEKPQIIDGRDHLLGRLASIVSRELLAGQSIVLVRCDEIVVSGSCECRRENITDFSGSVHVRLRRRGSVKDLIYSP